jgi:hypothetical protein
VDLVGVCGHLTGNWQHIAAKRDRWSTAMFFLQDLFNITFSCQGGRPWQGLWTLHPFVAEMANSNRKVICRCFYGYFQLMAAWLYVWPAAAPE